MISKEKLTALRLQSNGSLYIEEYLGKQDVLELLDEIERLQKIERDYLNEHTPFSCGEFKK